MTLFSPPMEERPTGELIGIKNSSTDHWQQEAIDQATTELAKRKVTRAEEQHYLDEWQKELKAAEEERQRLLEKNITVDYTLFEKVLIFVFAPIIIIYFVKNYLNFRELRKENYRLKIKQRYRLLIAGSAVWVIILFAAMFYSGWRPW